MNLIENYIQPGYQLRKLSRQEVPFEYDGKGFVLDTKEMKNILGGLSFKDAEVSQFIREYLDTNKAEVDDGKTL